MYVLNDNQKKELNNHEISSESFLNQIDQLNNGSLYVDLIRPALLHDGIKIISKNEKEKMISIFSQRKNSYKIVKFIPASGAATRMFKTLINVKNMIKNNQFPHTDNSLDSSENIDRSEFKTFLNGLYLNKFAFTEDINSIIAKKNVSITELINKKEYLKIIEIILDKKGINYADTPKALVKFHKYKDAGITPLEEHILETCLYMEGEKPFIHFSISYKFKLRILDFLQKSVGRFAQTSRYFSYEISFQKKSTDTIAINTQGDPVLTPEGELLFRPGGHGSLIHNLNELEADIVFIKNIDNILTRDRSQSSIEYKMVMGGILIETREIIFRYLNLLPKIKKDSEIINDIYCYSKDILNIFFQKDFLDLNVEKKKEILINKLNRPLRICGMVENKGEPGGGPFWIRNRDGDESLQIVEKAQIDINNKEQAGILKNSKYFNPVDIVCSITDFNGEKFNLPDFSDNQKYFVSEKYYNSENIRILEHPGLWNGAMEKWITIFIEIPVETFNPVKSVNDLLKENHQPDKNIAFFDK